MNFLKRDLKEEARIRRKQLFEEERKKRIFDPKTRLFGVDVEAWQHQLLEKQKQLQAEQIEKEKFTRTAIEQERKCLERARAEAEARRDVERDIVEFRQRHQIHPIINEIPPCPDIPRFDGQDDNRKRRENRQQEETRAWLTQQMMENKQKTAQQRANDAKMAEAQMAKDRRACELAQLEEQCRRKLEMANLQYNQLSAEERAARDRAKVEQENRIAAKEIRNWVTGDWLCENPAVASSAFGPQRVIPYMYKGQSPEELQETRQQQMQQTLENKMKKEKKAVEEMKWHHHETVVSKKASNNVQKMLDEQRELDMRLVTVNAQLAEQQKRKQAEMNESSRQVPTVEYYQQFNRSTY